jgi:hypothetical protein
MKFQLQDHQLKGFGIVKPPQAMSLKFIIVESKQIQSRRCSRTLPNHTHWFAQVS